MLNHIKKRYPDTLCKQLAAISFLYLWILPLQTFAQQTIPQLTVTVQASNKTIGQILDEISLQTGYYFTYDSRLFPDKKKVDFSVNHVYLDQALDSLLGDPRMDYRVIDHNIVLYRKNETPPAPLIHNTDQALIKGKVLEERTGDPLSYATIALLGTSLGSITNQAGEFSFKIPGYLPNPMLVVSYIGYKNKYVPVTYPADEPLNIELEKAMISLQEVIIRYQDPVLLLQESLNRIPENYLSEDSRMTAFYRESVKRNDHCLTYTEAILEIAKSPYSDLVHSDQVRILKGRKITDVSIKDTVLLKLRSGIYTSLSLDIVKNKPDFLSPDFLAYYDLKFSDIVTYGNRLVYVINFHQKDFITEPLFTGQLYLDLESLAIVAADFQFNPELIYKDPGIFLVSKSPGIKIRPIMAKYHVDYRNEGNRYFISQVRAEVEMKVRKRKHWIGSRYRIELEMAITDVIPGMKVRIDPKDRVKVTNVLADENFEFDPSFWGTFNTIEPEASLKESIEKIKENLENLSP